MSKKEHKKRAKKLAKNAKLHPPIPLKYEMADVVNLARTIVTVNPAMKDRTVDAMAESIINTIHRAYDGGKWFVSTAGYIAIFDPWEEVTFVELYVQSDMVYNRLYPKSEWSLNSI